MADLGVGEIPGTADEADIARGRRDGDIAAVDDRSCRHEPAINGRRGLHDMADLRKLVESARAVAALQGHRRAGDSDIS
jgi:hypothetical protein